jgi:hypothetical protein
MPRNLTHPRPEPKRSPAPRSDESRSRPRAGRRRGSGGGSAESNRAMSTGYMSSRGSLPRRPWRIRRRRRRRKRRAMGGGLPPRGGIPHPVTKGCRGGRGAGTHDGHGGVRRRAVNGGGRTHRRGVGECRGGVDERSGGSDKRRACRTLEEEKAGLLQFAVGGILPRCPQFRGAGA